jgi:hypothetical protein
MISGFFAFFTRKKGNFRVFSNRRFFNMEPPHFIIFARFDQLMSRVCPAEMKLCGGRRHRLLMTLENKISTFKNFS